MLDSSLLSTNQTQSISAHTTSEIVQLLQKLDKSISVILAVAGQMGRDIRSLHDRLIDDENQVPTNQTHLQPRSVEGGVGGNDSFSSAGSSVKFPHRSGKTESLKQSSGGWEEEKKESKFLNFIVSAEKALKTEGKPGDLELVQCLFEEADDIIYRDQTSIVTEHIPIIGLKVKLTQHARTLRSRRPSSIRNQE